MQTFLPLPDFVETARCLDTQRLGKQRVEGFQILEVLFGLRQNWQHHPVVMMWQGSEFHLYDYTLSICAEWARRGYRDEMTARTTQLMLDAMRAGRLPADRPKDLPWWLGYMRFHESHKSNLIRKAPEHYGKIWPDVPDNLPYVWPDPMPLE